MSKAQKFQKSYIFSRLFSKNNLLYIYIGGAMQKNNIKLRYNIYMFVCLVLMLTVLGSVFGITFAYLNGKIENSTEAPNPYVEAGIYYNSTLLSEDSITGSIDANGAVSLKVNNTNISKSSNSFALPLYVKNTGNIDAYLLSVMVIIDFYDGENLSPVSNNSGEDTYYLTLKTPNTFTVVDNTLYMISSDIVLNKNGGNRSQILTSINLATEDVIKNSNLINKNFTMTILAEIGQEGIEDI